MTKHVISLIIFLAFSTYSFSSEEGFFGKYISINNGIKVEFTLTENGISDLIVDSITVDTGSLKYDYLARYGSSQVFQIRFDDITKCSNEIKLFIVENDGEFVITTGYYIQYKMKDDKLIVLRKQALELAWENDPNFNDSIPHSLDSSFLKKQNDYYTTSLRPIKSYRYDSLAFMKVLKDFSEKEMDCGKRFRGLDSQFPENTYAIKILKNETEKGFDIFISPFYFYSEVLNINYELFYFKDNYFFIIINEPQINLSVDYIVPEDIKNKLLPLIFNDEMTDHGHGVENHGAVTQYNIQFSTDLIIKVIIHFPIFNLDKKYWPIENWSKINQSIADGKVSRLDIKMYKDFKRTLSRRVRNEWRISSRLRKYECRNENEWYTL